MYSMIQFEHQYELHGPDEAKPPTMGEATADALNRPFQAVFEQYFQELSKRGSDGNQTD
ncbi:MAG: hypothetical protein J0M33_03650 [Anaerolineae bacterium]|nr:hypothetical protein [Anaerolineae bacterium]